MSAGELYGRFSDAADRLEAATRFDRNVVVTAGAGTGKTALLIERALNMIGRGLVPVEALAVITFTDKAAAELRRRLAAGLDRLRRLASRRPEDGGEETGSEADRAYAWLTTGAGESPRAIADRALEALLAVDAASVSTIHAFCSEILRRYPREAGVDPDFTVDQGPAFDRIFDEEWDRFLLDELGRRFRRQDAWRHALRDTSSLDLVRELARRLASFSIPTELLTSGGAHLAARPQDLIRMEAERARASVQEILARAANIPGTMERFLRSSEVFLGTFLESGDLSSNAEPTEMGLEEYCRRDLPGAGKRLVGATPEEVGAAAKSASDLIRALAAVDEERVAALLRLALPMAQRCRERLLSAGFVSFDALLRLTRDLLLHHPSIRRALARRYQKILVDEFQDTDPLQYEILLFIAGADGPDRADPHLLDLAPGRLFIVGDPMQSIYRFRGADIEAYDRTVRRLLACGGTALRLSASFRSPQALLDPINALFSGWIGPEAEEDAPFEPRYEPITSARRTALDDRSRVEIWSVDVRGNAEEGRRAEAAAIGNWLLENRDRETATGAPLAWKDVAILLRALTNAGLYAGALRQAGIPFIVEGGKDFHERREVSDFLSLLAAINPHDGAAVLAVMRSPLGGVPDGELALFAAAGGRFDLADGGLSDSTPFPNVRRTLSHLAAFRRRTIGCAPDDIVRAAMVDTPLPLIHASAHDGAQRLVNLRKLARRAEELARQGLSLEETLRAIEEEFQGERAEGESPLADETVNAVRILSVHKAKGLEYPVVFVPDLGRSPGHAGDAGTEVASVAHDRSTELAVRLDGGGMNYAWAHHKRIDRKHEVAEEKRVLYVACTRASELLLLVNSRIGRSAPWRDALVRLGYDVTGGLPVEGPLMDGLVEHRRPPGKSRPKRTRPREIDRSWVEAANRFDAVAASVRSAAIPPISWPAGTPDAKVELPDANVTPVGGARHEAIPRPGEDLDRYVALAAGTAVHAALERWDFRSAAELRSAAALEARRAAAGGRAGLDGTTLGRVTQETRAIIEGFLGSPLPGRLAEEEILGREMPILYRDDGGTIWMGACDLVYRDREGRIVVADYKTDRLTSIPRLSADRYRAQIGVYVQALSRALPGETVRAEVIFLRAGRAVPL